MSHSRPDPLLFSLQQMIIDLSMIDRNHHLAKTDRHENDIGHSFTVAVLCWYIIDKHGIDLDVAKVLKYAMIHDFVEVYAGDVNKFASPSERKAKIEREKESLARLSDEFSSFADMVSLMQEYELREDEEALFVWTVDKMQDLLMGYMDDWRPYISAGVSYDQFTSKYKELTEKSSKYCREIFEDLIEYTKPTYYDRPTS